MLLSDASCAAILLNSAIECAIVNVRINLGTLTNKNYAEKTEKELQELEMNSQIRKDKVNEEIKKR